MPDGALVRIALPQVPSGETVSKMIIERAFSPCACCNSILGLRPRLIWNAPLALSNARFHYDLSAEGAMLYQPGAQPQD
jgi:hypothetical protein